MVTNTQRTHSFSRVCVCVFQRQLHNRAKQTRCFYSASIWLCFISLLQLGRAQGQVVGTHQKVNAWLRPHYWAIFFVFGSYRAGKNSIGRKRSDLIQVRSTDPTEVMRWISTINFHYDEYSLANSWHVIHTTYTIIYNIIITNETLLHLSKHLFNTVVIV